MVEVTSGIEDKENQDNSTTPIKQYNVLIEKANVYLLLLSSEDDEGDDVRSKSMMWDGHCMADDRGEY